MESKCVHNRSNSGRYNIRNEFPNQVWSNVRPPQTATDSNKDKRISRSHTINREETAMDKDGKCNRADGY